MDINITDTINADQIEDGDQIAVSGDHLENVVIDTPKLPTGNPGGQSLLKVYELKMGKSIDKPLACD